MAAHRMGRHRVSAPTLVGRAQELATLAQVLARPPAVAVVEGEAGIGKTRLVAELRTQPAIAERRVVTGACRRIREPFPLGPLVEAVRDLRDELTPGHLSPVAGALRPLLPELAAVLPPLPEPLDDRAAERHRVFRALTVVLTSVGPAVLVIEDMHWADQHTVDFLSYLLGDPPPELSVLVTFRGEEVDPAVRTVTSAPAEPVGRAQVALTPLDVAQTGALAAAILGQDMVSGEFASYLHERASGLPFVIEELLALMQARGVLVRRDGAGDWVRKTIDELDVPAGVRDPVRERFGGLAAPARAVAEAAAVLQVPAPPPLLVATSRLAGSEASSGVEEAMESGLLVEHGAGTVGFRHLLAAQAVYEAISGPRRRQLHAGAAAALGALDPVPLGQRAHHLRRSGNLPEWVDAAERAADQAMELGHDDEAIRLLEDMLRAGRSGAMPLTAADRSRLAIKLSRAAHQVLHFGTNVTDLLAEVLDQDLPPAVRGELRLRLSLLHERAGTDLHLQRRLLTEAVPDLEERPELMAHAMAGLGIPCVPGVPLAEHQRWLQRVLEVVPAVDDPSLQVSLMGKVAMVRVAVGDPRWRELADRILAQTGGAPRHPAEMTALHSVGANACYAGHLAMADRLLTAVLAKATTAEGRWREMAARATLALLDYCRGAWDGLAERAGDLVGELADHAPGRADVEVVAGCLALARGDIDRMSPRTEELARLLAERGAFDVLPIIAGAAIRMTVGRGEIPAAVEQAHRFLAVVESVPLVVSAAWALPSLTEALAAGGQADQAQDVLARWASQLDDLDAPLAPAAVPHSRGVLAAAGERWHAAADEFLAAAAQYEQRGFPYEAARAREQAGSSLLRCGRAQAGGTELHTALTTFQWLGATWDLDRGSRIARQYAVPVPARHRRGRRGYGEELSPREREVAELAAQGRRNKEIADELFLSASTVRKQLTAAMRKLGVGSRAALAHQLASERRDGGARSR